MIVLTVLGAVVFLFASLVVGVQIIGTEEPLGVTVGVGAATLLLIGVGVVCVYVCGRGLIGIPPLT